MWNVGEKTIISIGKPFSAMSFLKKKQTEYHFVEVQSIQSFFKELPSNQIEIALVIVQFTDWTPDLIKLLSFFKGKESVFFSFIFESKDEFNLHFQRMNTARAYGFIKNDLISEQLQQFCFNLGLTPELNPYMTAEKLSLKTQIKIPVSLESVSNGYLVIQKPTFSKEVEEIEFELNFRQLQLIFSSQNKNIEFTDNKIIIKDDFSNVVDRLSTLGAQTLPFIKVAIFSKVITKEIQNLYNMPNVSISFYRNPQVLDDGFNLVIINEVYIENNPFSDEVLKKIELHNQNIVVFNAQSSSRAYQKVYKYKKILLHESSFSVSTIIDLVMLTQKKIDQDCYFLNEWENLGLGDFLVAGEISMLNEIEYKLLLPFSLSSATILKSSFWEEITGDILEYHKEKNEYSHLVRFSNLSELESNLLRVFLNKVIFYQDNFKEPLRLESYSRFAMPEIPKESA